LRTEFDYDPNSSLKKNGRTVWVKNIRNFTMFFAPALSTKEKQRKGNLSLIAKGSVTASRTERAGNVYGIDNVLIVREIKQRQDIAPTYPVVKTYYSSQTNKIVRIAYDPSVVDPTITSEIPGEITFYDPLYVDSTIGVTNIGTDSDTAESYLDNSICDVEKFYGSDILLNNSASTCYSLLRGTIEIAPTTTSAGGSRYMGNQLGAPPTGYKARPSFLPYYYDIPYKGSVYAKTFRQGTINNPVSGTVDPDPTTSWDFTGYISTMTPITEKYPSGYVYDVKYYVIHLTNIKTTP
jgi:hypothetical protein